MIKRIAPFLGGLLSGLFSAGLLYLLLAGPRGAPITLIPVPTPGPVRVHVAGAVADPGVYLLSRTAIWEDALAAAGGPLDEAALSIVNLAAPIEDGQQIYIPMRSEDTTPRHRSEPGKKHC